MTKSATKKKCNPFFQKYTSNIIYFRTFDEQSHIETSWYLSLLPLCPQKNTSEVNPFHFFKSPRDGFTQQCYHQYALKTDSSSTTTSSISSRFPPSLSIISSELYSKPTTYSKHIQSWAKTHKAVCIITHQINTYQLQIVVPLPSHISILHISTTHNVTTTSFGWLIS